MTLALGDHVVKLDKEGKPLTIEKEVYIEYEVVMLTGYKTRPSGDVLVGAVLQKVN